MRRHKGFVSANVLTCGQCALVRGFTLKNTSERFNTLIESGLVVPGQGGRMVNVETYEEAVKIRGEYPHKITREQMIKDSRDQVVLWHKLYFGFEPKSHIQNFIYKRKLKKALAKAANPGICNSRCLTPPPMGRTI